MEDLQKIMTTDRDTSARILAFAGSSRMDSWNKKLVAIAAAGARDAGAQIIDVDLAEYPMPIYNGDWEKKNGQPPKAKELKSLMVECDGFLIGSPEYNGGYSPLLKNTIDWISRPSPGEPPLSAFAGKKAALLSASPGALGGIRGLAQLRQILTGIQVIVLPKQMALANAQNAFNADGSLNDRAESEKVAEVGATLAIFIEKLR